MERRHAAMGRTNSMDIEDLFAFQDRITDAVVGLIEPEVRKAEIDRARRKHPSSLGAYDLYLRALPNFRSASDTSRHSAIQQLEEAIALDAGFSAWGFAYGAWAHERQFLAWRAGPWRGWIGAAPWCLPMPRRRSTPTARWSPPSGGSALINVGGDRARGITMVVEAARAHPNDHTVLFLAGYGNILFGDVDIGRRGLSFAPSSWLPARQTTMRACRGSASPISSPVNIQRRSSWPLLRHGRQHPMAAHAVVSRGELARISTEGRRRMAIVARLRAETLPASLNALRQFRLQSLPRVSTGMPGRAAQGRACGGLEPACGC